MKIQIKTVFGDILYESTTATNIKEAVIEKYKVDANLRGANLRGADLRDADLHGADLRDADLHGADLRGADLRDADLRDADLRDADLHGANLRDADLHGANLYDANLRGADLYDANLRDANLRGAYLHGANLAKLPADYINQSSRDILFILQMLRTEVPFLKEKLLAGEIDGTQYEGDCACLVGTLAHGENVGKVCSAIPFYEKGTHNMGETWFLNIRKGDTPETNQFAAHVMKLIEMVETGKYYTIIY